MMERNRKSELVDARRGKGGPGAELFESDPRGHQGGDCWVTGIGGYVKSEDVINGGKGGVALTLVLILFPYHRLSLISF